jgi:type I restriction enzyme R subunit
VLRLPPIDHLGTPIELVRAFGGKPQYLQALQVLEAELYRPAPPGS